MPEIVDSLSIDMVQGASVAHDRYKTLFERVNASAFLTELSGQILEANHRSSEFLGYEWHELPRLSLADVLPPETDWTGIHDELAARGGLNVETDCVCKDGTRRPVEVSFSVFRMEARIVMFVLLWDIQERRTAQQRLKESEKKYRGLFEFATDGIIVLDARGDIIDVNTRVCELVDLAKQEMVAKNLFGMNLLTARSLPIVVGQFESLLSEKKASVYTSEVQTKSGRILDVEISSFFLVKKDNEVDNFVLILRDVTARNESERIQAREHELFHTLLDTVPEAVSFKDENHRYLLVNKAKAEHVRVRPEQMIGKTDRDFYPEDVAARLLEEDSRIVQSGVPVINKIEQTTDAYHHDQWSMVTKIPRYSADGEIIGTMDITRNITDWHTAEQEQKKTQGLLRILIDALPDPVVVKDQNHIVVVANRAFAELVHLTPEQLVGKATAELFSADHAKRAEEDEKLAMVIGISTEARTENIRMADGMVHQVVIHILPWTSDTTVHGTLTILHRQP